MPKCTKLKVQVLVTFSSGATQSLEALVDTGAEVSLIHPKWVPATDFFLSPRPIKLGVANSHLLVGGQRQTDITLTVKGTDMDTGCAQLVCLPLSAYDAEVVCDLILSYGWMTKNHILPDPRRHGITLSQKVLTFGYQA